MSLRFDAEGAPWALGLEWFWAGAPGVTASYLAPVHAGSWQHESPPCADAVVDCLVELGSEQWMLCGTGLFSRHREGAFRLRLEGAFHGGELAVVAGALLLQKDGAWFEVVESGARFSDVR